MTDKFKILFFLILLILIWGIGWPIITIGLPYCPAIWYSVLRLIIGAVIIFIAMAVSGNLTIPRKRDLPFIFSIGFLQMGVFVLLITLGLQYVPPGRSAILAYTSPFFVTPIAVFFFKETLSPLKIVGLLLGVVGIVLLFSPWQFNWHDPHTLFGNGLLILSSLVWSIVMLHTRYGKWHSSPTALLPWQALISPLPSLIAALLLAPHPIIQFTNTFWFSMLYTAILSTPVAYWLVTMVSRALPVITTSLALLAIPVVGLLSSVVMVHEALTFSILLSLGLIIVGLICISIPSRARDD